MGHQYCDSCNKFCEACAAARESELTALRAKVAAGEALRKRVGDQYIERNSHCCDGYALRCPAHIMCIEYDAAISK